MLPGNGKIERTGFGSDSKCKEAVNTAFNYLKANGNRISGTMIKVDELANTLQVCLNSGAKKVLIPYQSAEDAVFKALGVE